MVKLNGSTLEVPSRLVGQVTTATQQFKPLIEPNQYSSTFVFETSEVAPMLAALDRIGLRIRTESMDTRLTTRIRRILSESTILTKLPQAVAFIKASGLDERIEIRSSDQVGFDALIDGQQVERFDFPFDQGAFEEVLNEIDTILADPKVVSVVLDGTRYIGEIDYQYPTIGRGDDDAPVHEGDPTGYDIPTIWSFDGHEVTDQALFNSILREIKEKMSSDQQ